MVTIPCRNEPDLHLTLQSLALTKRPENGASVEVLVGFNTAPADSLEIHKFHDTQKNFFQSKDHLERWIGALIPAWMNFHAIQAPCWQKKVAGVGAARKLLMDEALRRFLRLNRPEGWILCLDADCLCDSQYFVSLAHAFQRNPDAVGAHAFFDHQEPPADQPFELEAIQLYELGLRYYRLALHWTGFPQAPHTVGSCMMARVDAYAKMGGINRRQAGEDFYFVHKLIQGGPFIHVNECRVFPSARVSDRVPFGTGKAVGEMLETCRNATSGTNRPVWEVEPFQGFIDLRYFFTDMEVYFQAGLKADWKNQLKEISHKWSPALLKYLHNIHWQDELDRILRSTGSRSGPLLVKRFYHWFNGFKCMKYLRFAQETYQPQAVVSAAIQLLDEWGPGYKAQNNQRNRNAMTGIADQLRELDRQVNQQNLNP